MYISTHYCLFALCVLKLDEYVVWTQYMYASQMDFQGRNGVKVVYPFPLKNQIAWHLLSCAAKNIKLHVTESGLLLQCTCIIRNILPTIVAWIGWIPICVNKQDVHGAQNVLIFYTVDGICNENKSHIYILQVL